MRGKKIDILESRLGRQLVDLVAQRGAVAFHAPALAELPDLDPQAIAALVRSLQAAPAKLAVFQTGVGTRTLVASIGPVASAALREAGIAVGLEASPPKLGALITSLDQALS